MKRERIFNLIKKLTNNVYHPDFTNMRRELNNLTDGSADLLIIKAQDHGINTVINMIKLSSKYC